jgi:hypothetical protein
MSTPVASREFALFTYLARCIETICWRWAKQTDEKRTDDDDEQVRIESRQIKSDLRS